MLGRPRPTESADARLIALTAAVDQALTLTDQTMRANTGNRDLVDLCLDLRSILGKDPTR